MKRRPTLDRVDRVILAELQRNARITNVELAGRSGISAPACLRRVRALEEAGVITGYMALLDPAALEHFRAKWMPVRVKKMRLSKGLERFCDSEKSENALGFALTMFAQIGLHSQSEADLARFTEHLAGLDAVREACLVTGESDYLLKCVARDVADMHAVINRLTALPNVASVKTSIALATAWHQPGIPVE